MKYLIAMTGSQQHYDAIAGKGTDDIPAWKPDEVKAMVEYMQEMNAELLASGELVGGEGLTDPAHARRVQLRDGEIVITDGPYAETAEVLAGYWLVDVDSFDRATEIAAKAAKSPAPAGFPTSAPIDIRPVGEAPSF